MTVIVKGQVTRSQMIVASATVSTDAPGGQTVWVEGKFDKGCNGDPEWTIMPLSSVTLKSGESRTIEVGGFCNDMPVGARTFSITVYGDSDKVTALDSVVVQFELTE